MIERVQPPAIIWRALCKQDLNGMSAIGPSRHFAAARQSRCFRAEADIGLDFMSARRSDNWTTNHILALVGQRLITHFNVLQALDRHLEPMSAAGFPEDD